MRVPIIAAAAAVVVSLPLVFRCRCCVAAVGVSLPPFPQLLPPAVAVIAIRSLRCSPVLC